VAPLPYQDHAIVVIDGDHRHGADVFDDLPPRFAARREAHGVLENMQQPALIHGAASHRLLTKVTVVDIHEPDCSASASIEGARAPRSADAQAQLH
jgi:hypothetical protein